MARFRSPERPGAAAVDSTTPAELATLLEVFPHLPASMVRQSLLMYDNDVTRAAAHLSTQGGSDPGDPHLRSVCDGLNEVLRGRESTFWRVLVRLCLRTKFGSHVPALSSEEAAVVRAYSLRAVSGIRLTLRHRVDCGAFQSYDLHSAISMPILVQSLFSQLGVQTSPLWLAQVQARSTEVGAFAVPHNSRAAVNVESPLTHETCCTRVSLSVNMTSKLSLCDPNQCWYCTVRCEAMDVVLTAAL